MSNAFSDAQYEFQTFRLKPAEDLVTGYRCLQRILGGLNFDTIPTENQLKMIKDGFRRLLTPSAFNMFQTLWLSKVASTSSVQLLAIVRQISKVNGYNANILAEEDAHDINALRARALACHFCRAPHMMADCPELRNLRSLNGRVDKLEANVSDIKTEMSQGFSALLEQLKVNGAQANVTERQDKQKEGVRGRNKRPWAPHCLICPIESSGYPPRHFPQQCPKNTTA